MEMITHLVFKSHEDRNCMENIIAGVGKETIELSLVCNELP